MAKKSSFRFLFWFHGKGKLFSMNGLSVVIITKNEETVIVDCLDSVQFANEVIVIDAGSEDRTTEIAKKKGAIVFHHEFTNFSQQRNFGMSKTQYPWVLYIDADERVTEKLQEEIVDVVKNYNE